MVLTDASAPIILFWFVDDQRALPDWIPLERSFLAIFVENVRVVEHQLRGLFVLKTFKLYKLFQNQAPGYSFS